MNIKMLQKMNEIVEKLLTQKTKEEIYFAQRFDKFFEQRDYLFCYEMIEQGYSPTKKEKERLNSLFLLKLENDEYSYDKIANFKSIDPEIRLVGILKTVPNYFSNTGMNIKSVLFDNNSMIHNTAFVLKELNGNKQVVLDYNKKALLEFKKYFSSAHKARDFTHKNSATTNKKLQKIQQLIMLNVMLIKSGELKHFEIEEIKLQYEEASDYIYSKTMDHWKSKSNFDEFVLALNDYNKDVVKEDKEDLLRQLKSYSVRKNSLAEGINNIIVHEEYNVSNLPEEAKEKVNKIRTIGSLMDNQEVNEFIQERLPVILKRYFSIDNEYRETLKSVEGFNAQELMLQSLDNIEKIIIAKKENKNVDLLSELSIENRKLKMK